MLAIRFQRTGRRGQAKFRVIVQDSRRTPTSGRVVANLGHYNPHTKEHGVDFDRLQTYLSHGAQPSPRVVNLLVSQKIKLPAWVKPPVERQRPIRNPDKLRRNRPAGTEAPPDEVKTPESETETTPEDNDSPESGPEAAEEEPDPTIVAAKSAPVEPGPEVADKTDEATEADSPDKKKSS